MSNRTDWDNLTDELFEMFGLDDNGFEELRKRLRTEFHNAFIAGQEQSAAVDDAGDMIIDDELAHLRAFKAEWARLDGNSPGYNCDKAKNYGNKGSKYRQLFEAYKKAADAMSCLQIVNISWDPACYAAGMLIKGARDLEVKLMGEWKPSELPPLWGKSPVEELAKRQIQDEIVRRKQSECKHEHGINQPDGHRCSTCGWLIDTQWRGEPNVP